MARYRNQRQKRPLMSEMNVVPYIDVMLVLLVIFMITAPLLTTGVEVDLPDADAKPVQSENQSEPLVLSINDAGEWFLNTGEGKDIPVDQEAALKLSAEALQDNPNRGVMVRADENINYGLVMEAMVTLQGAGAEKVQLMSDPAS
ncbi:MAG: protein TolR [Pseudomonadota bacterium]